MSDISLFAQIEALERQLHDPLFWVDGDRLLEVLHPDVMEFGRSGRSYTFQDLLCQVPERWAYLRIHADHFVGRLVAEGVVLLTYRSARFDDSGALVEPALRSSIWCRYDDKWKLVFHQGTPTRLFERNQDLTAASPDGEAQTANPESSVRRR